MATQKYRQTSEDLLAQARGELAQGDLIQASEKGWGAAAQMLKAIAEERGLEHGRHRHLTRVASHLTRVASHLRSQTGDGDLFRLYQVAEALHGNFYENEYAPENIAQSLDDVERLLDKLDPLIDAPGQPG